MCMFKIWCDLVPATPVINTRPIKISILFYIIPKKSHTTGHLDHLDSEQVGSHFPLCQFPSLQEVPAPLHLSHLHKLHPGHFDDAV